MIHAAFLVRKTAAVVAIAAWGLCVAAGTLVLNAHQNRPGERGKAPPRWPVASCLKRDAIRPTLVMLAHPKCPCTTASLDELERILTLAPARLNVQILFIKPEGTARDWVRTPNYLRMLALPSVHVFIDDEGKEARLFGAKTSGEALVYEPGGDLLFHGGITGSRGHPGENVGENTVIALANKNSSTTHATSVFGCPLFDHSGRSGSQPSASESRQ